MGKRNKKKIVLTGGGTLGSVSPLLAIFDKLENEYNFLWVGSRNGPEKEIIKKEGIIFLEISSGKLRRYFSFKNFIDIFKIFFAFFESFFLLLREKPNLIISAGSFVSVPLVWAAWVLKIPVLIHQLDLRAGLANKLMAGAARKISVTFEKSLDDYGVKAVWVGNPLRDSFFKKDFDILELKKEFNLSLTLPLVLVVGGGTGAEKINEMILDISPEIIKNFELVHLSGKGKMKKKISLDDSLENYHQYEFLKPELMAKYLFMADIVISRGGMGFLTELSFLKKAAIIIPMLDSHQEDNAKILEDNQSVIVLSEKRINKKVLYDTIIKIWKDEKLKNNLEKNIGSVIRSGEESSSKFIKLIQEIIRN